MSGAGPSLTRPTGRGRIQHRPVGLGDPATAAALRAMHADPAAPWSNDRLAAEAGVSRPTLARRFTALVGRPPMTYLTWWRVIRAATLLRDTRQYRAQTATPGHHTNPDTPYDALRITPEAARIHESGTW